MDYFRSSLLWKTTIIVTILFVGHDVSLPSAACGVKL
jgi:hypothetical protein